MDTNKRLIAFICETGLPGLPQHVRYQSKRCLLDTLGAQIAGHRTPVGDMMSSVARASFRGAWPVCYYRFC